MILKISVPINRYLLTQAAYHYMGGGSPKDTLNKKSILNYLRIHLMRFGLDDTFPDFPDVDQEIYEWCEQFVIEKFPEVKE